MKSQNTFSGIKIKNLFSRILDGLILFVFILFFSSAGFKDKNTSGWYQQFFPNMNGSSITSITFIDSLTGFAVTNTNSSLQAYILKTTNGGDNWMINYTYTQLNSNWNFVKIGFIDSNIGYAFGWSEMFKTTNSGTNWNIIVNNLYANDIAIINKDTILAVKNSGFDGGVYRTTNGGYNWQAMGQTGGNGQPSTIYMYNKDMGFCLGSEMRKTTNSGVNWFTIAGETYAAIVFVDSLTGWKVWDSIKKTTNGGLNWYAQQTPNISTSFSYSSFSAINKDTVWMVGARKFGRPPVYKTTNGGINWGYQYPDTTLQLYSFGFISFVNKLNGWVYPASISSMLHTTTGGSDTTYITKVNNQPVLIPTDYILYQNYPNPFNPSTTIKYELKRNGYIRLKVFDINGKEIITLVSKKQNSGPYEVKFDASNLSSGTYLYQLSVNNEQITTKKMIVIK